MHHSMRMTIRLRLKSLFGFFLVVSLGAQFTGTVLPRTTIILVVVSGLLLHSVRWYRGVLGLRSWW